MVRGFFVGGTFGETVAAVSEPHSHDRKSTTDRNRDAGDEVRRRATENHCDTSEIGGYARSARGSPGSIGTVARTVSAYRNCENAVADVQRCLEIAQEDGV
jgi:hypothetical protein